LLSSYPEPDDDDLELDEDDPVVPESDQIEHKEYALATPTRNPAMPYFVVVCRLDKEYAFIIILYIKVKINFKSVCYMYYYFYIYQYQYQNQNESSPMFYHKLSAYFKQRTALD
jgi:hypothetical protein